MEQSAETALAVTWAVEAAFGEMAAAAAAAVLLALAAAAAAAAVQRVMAETTKAAAAGQYFPGGIMADLAGIFAGGAEDKMAKPGNALVVAAGAPQHFAAYSARRHAMGMGATELTEVAA